jgi:hypothetical protein
LFAELSPVATSNSKGYWAWSRERTHLSAALGSLAIKSTEAEKFPHRLSSGTFSALEFRNRKAGWGNLPSNLPSLR